MRDSLHRITGGPWLKACAAYAPSTRVTIDEAIREGWYGDAEHAKDQYVSIAVEREWWPAEMALATTRAALVASGADRGHIGQLTYASIHRHGNARLWQPAAYLQNALGVPQALAFSLSHGCNGMFVAAKVALDALRCDPSRDALVVGADRFGTSMFDRWRGDYGVLYGDAAAAAVFGSSGGFARVLHLSIAGVPELEGMHRHSASHIEHIGCADALQEFGVRDSKKAFMERYGREKFFDAIGEALSRLREDVLDRFALHAQPADWLITPHLGVAISAPLYVGKFNEFARRHFDDYGRRIGHTGTADQFASLAALAASGQLTNGQRVLLVGSGAGFSCGLMLLEIHDVSRATLCEEIHSTLWDLER